MDRYEITEQVGTREIPIVEFDHVPHDTYSLSMMRGTTAPISRVALDQLVQDYTGRVPTDALRRAAQHQLIDAHNEAIDKRKAQKRQVKKLAKDAGISPATLRRMLGRK